MTDDEYTRKLDQRTFAAAREMLPQISELFIELAEAQGLEENELPAAPAKVFGMMLGSTLSERANAALGVDLVLQVARGEALRAVAHLSKGRDNKLEPTATSDEEESRTSAVAQQIAPEMRSAFFECIAQEQGLDAPDVASIMARVLGIMLGSWLCSQGRTGLGDAGIALHSLLQIAENEVLRELIDFNIAHFGKPDPSQ